MSDLLKVDDEEFRWKPSTEVSSEVTLDQLTATLQEVAATQMELMKQMDRQRADLLLVHSEMKSNYIAYEAWAREIVSRMTP
jgi:hypothetical protein